MKTRNVIISLIFMALPGFISLAPVYAATTAITGGTNGSSCNSGGYFNPSSVTITSGDTITFSVPSNDPYYGGLEIHNFPQGNFTVPTGGSVTTSPITADVSYYATWPSTGCMKGSGTITVSAPAPPPASGGSSGSTTGSTGSTTSSSTTKTKSTAKSTAATPAAAPAAAAVVAPTTSTSPADSTAKKSTEKTTKVAAAPATTKKLAYKMLAMIGGGAALAFAVAFFLVSRIIAHRKSRALSPTATQPQAEQPSTNDSTTINGKDGENNEPHQ